MQHLAASANEQKPERVSDDFGAAIGTTDYDESARNTFKNRVCVECESRANRAFWLTLFVIILVPVMAAMPAIIKYGGDTDV